MRGDTADVVWIEQRQVFWQRFDVVAEESVGDAISCVALRDWPKHSLHSLVARTDTDWSCIVYQDERVDENTPNNASLHATVMGCGESNFFTPLDSGRTTAHFPGEGDGPHGGYCLKSDDEGSLYASWLSAYFVMFDADVRTHAAWLGDGNAVHRTMTAFSGGFWIDPRNQALSLLETATQVRTISGSSSGPLTSCVFDSLSEWSGDCYETNEWLPAYLCYGLGVTSAENCVVLYGPSESDLAPRIALLELNDSTGYSASPIGSLQLSHLTNSFFHPAYGFAALQADPGALLLARIDTAGSEVQPPGVLYETDGPPFIVDADVTITDDGKVVAVWSEYTDWNEGPRQLKIAWTEWNTYLDTPEQNTPVVPQELSFSAFPNPFNSTVTIRYDLPQAGNVSLAVYDLQGRRVSTLIDEFARAGSGELRWSPENLASGVYFVSLESGFAHKTHKILYLK